MPKRHILTHRELESALEEIVNDLEIERGFVDAVYIPPNVDELTDEEDIDENLRMNDESIDKEIAGTLEIEVDIDNDICDEPEEPVPGKKRRFSGKKERENIEWEKKEVVYTHLPTSNEHNSLQQIKDALEGKTPLEIFLMFFDEELLTMIVEFSVKYARDNNRQDFKFCIKDLTPSVR
ncbi:uncharacterized protein [Diabrotica undecimpunctata]|uniref:uncharacterized protein n=1 Tax=Diabrotica undecimpunctata TaxID=50387 RepID=UPI003B641196